MSNILIGLCHEVANGASSSKHGAGANIDTWCNTDKTCFYKENATEMYPEHVLVYRDVSGPPDAHTSRLTDFVQHCQLSYRAGARYNPQEQSFMGQAADEIRVLESEEATASDKQKKKKKK